MSRFLQWSGIRPWMVATLVLVDVAGLFAFATGSAAIVIFVTGAAFVLGLSAGVAYRGRENSMRGGGTDASQRARTT